MTRRTLFGTAALAAAAQIPAAAQRRREWKPKLGFLTPYSEDIVAFAKANGYQSLILTSGPKNPLDALSITDADAAKVKQALAAAGIGVSALQVTQNHISPDPARRKSENDYFVAAIELAGKLGVPNIGAMSGKDPAKPFEAQVDEIVRVYTEKYFPACEKNKVRITWEPWPEGPNIATSPAGYEALFKAFGNSPHVGLQFDPSHFVRQFMDPIQTARDFVDKIYDVHLKDTEIRWDLLRKGGINPVAKISWWRYRLPGLGSIKWSEFFSVLQEYGYQGAMSVEHEDPFYEFKDGLVMAKRYLSQYVP
jgi:sugar phosphate isomerase/epimerase